MLNINNHGGTNLDSAVTIFGPLPQQEFIQFGFENSILDDILFLDIWTGILVFSNFYHKEYHLLK